MKPRYKKSEAVKLLERLADTRARAKYSDMPVQYLAPRKYRDDNANALTRCVIDWIRYNGYQAERISTTGRLIDRTKVVTDVLGNQRRIGSTQWLKSSGQKGSADISATIKSKSVKIEIKIGSDRQSPYQKQYQEAIERAGGIYFIARDFQQFLEFYKTL